MIHAWLDSFLAFGERRSFTRAALDLHITQPALHVQIAKLSKRLGVVLYRRDGRGLALTPEGERLLAFARELRERSASFAGSLRGSPEAGPLVLAAGEGAYLYLLGDAVREFTRAGRAPLRLLTRDREGTLQAVSSAEAHLGVTSLDAVPDGVAAERLTLVPVVAVLPRRHPLARKRTLRLRHLAGERLILPPPGRPLRDAVERALLSAGLKTEVAVEATGWELMIHFARLGMGVAVVNGFCRLSRDLVARPLPELPRVAYYLVRRPDGWLPPAAGTLRDLLREAAGRWRESLRRG